jgi:hypothetical protein
MNVFCRKVYVFFENLFHGIAVYSGVALIGRLEGKLKLQLSTFSL